MFANNWEQIDKGCNDLRNESIWRGSTWTCIFYTIVVFIAIILICLFAPRLLNRLLSLLIRPPPPNINNFRPDYYQTNFETTGRLGTGGYGVVFKAVLKENEPNDARRISQKNPEKKPKEYAIKRIALQNTEYSKERVMQEARALYELCHCNIVEYFDSWLEFRSEWQEEHDKEWAIKLSSSGCPSMISETETSDVSQTDSLSNNATKDSSSSDNNTGKADIFLYIQIELCSKGSLQEWLDSRREKLEELKKSEESKKFLEQDFPQVLNFFQEIVNAVEHIHFQGFIHRDLKPSNIFLARDNSIKIGDFGLVTAMTEGYDGTPIFENETQVDSVHTTNVGTFLYVPPEREKRQVYDEKIDIYSLGIIFYELLMPFSTYMERADVLKGLRKSIFPSNFAKIYPAAYGIRILTRMMLDENPTKRPPAGLIKKMLRTLYPSAARIDN